MAIVYMHDAQGAFICGDTKTRMTSYSYPSSANAQQARKAPSKIATAALAGQTRHKGAVHEADYDARNWSRLEAAGVI